MRRRAKAGHAPPAGPAYRFVEHGGEVELEFEAATEAGVFGAALTAFGELVAAEGGGVADDHEIELFESDHAVLLVDWLSELVFLAEVEEFVPEQVVAFDLAGERLRATVRGPRARPRQLVKAVTLNNLELAESGGIWHGRVVLDV